MSYTYALVEDVNGKIEGIAVNGKPVKKSFLNAFIKAQTSPQFVKYTTSTVQTNPFSGVSCVLNPLESMIYTFCMRWYRAYERGIQTLPVSVFDNMKYFLANINSDAYYDLLD